MKFRPWMSAAATAAMGLGLICLAPAVAGAEEQVTGRQVKTEWGTYRYRTFTYPSSTTGFYMMPKSYVTFDVVNGKYWMMEHPRAEYEVKRNANPEHVFPPLVIRESPLVEEHYAVSFFTPDMKFLGGYDEVRPHRWYDIPRDGNDYERIIVRLETDGDRPSDCKLQVYDPVDPVMSEPLPGVRYRY